MAVTFCVVGGDRRQTELVRLLTAEGKRVLTYGLENSCFENCTPKVLAEAEIVILPLPLCREDGVLNSETVSVETGELFRLLRPEQLILAGQVSPEQRAEAAECGLSLWDYFRREDLTVANAAVTAEGAIQIAMEHLDCTILNLPCLVLGFGRIGKLLALRLRGMGANVTVAARRNEDLAWIRACGCCALPIGAVEEKVSDFSVIFNTVPAPVLNGRSIERLEKTCLCVDIASERGIDAAAAEARGVTCIWARSLPGRLKPAAAAKAIRDAVYNIIIEERGSLS